MAILIDLVVVLVLVYYLCRGARQGFVLALCGLVAVIIAFVGARVLADGASPHVAAAVEPQITATIEKMLKEQFSAEGSSGLTDGEAILRPLEKAAQLLRASGVYEALVEKLDKAIEQGAAAAIATAAAAIAAAMTQTLIHALLFAVAFTAILVAWTLLSQGLNLVTKLPGLHLLNTVGGAAIGLVQGGLVLIVLVWILGFFHGLIPSELFKQTHLLRLFQFN